ncbi:hypothetical protein Avbf_07061 [Armadillidium vulgare]|nr:hypothetical protein Avbf_08950 [Armadillidium vulgare]RXG70331.1 hypothetical protein Avbf_07061 [Armadillidium vulgare]
MILREALTETVIQEVRVYFQEMKANSSHKEVNEIEERSEEVIEFIETHIETESSWPTPALGNYSLPVLSH